MATIEREAIQETAHSGVIHEAVAAELLARIDRRIERLDNAAHDSEQELQRAIEQLYPADEQRDGQGAAER